MSKIEIKTVANGFQVQFKTQSSMEFMKVSEKGSATWFYQFPDEVVRKVRELLEVMK
jgi:hypothetical protein